MTTSPVPAALTATHRSVVTDDQIDHLGHMNVRFYGVNARAATDEVVRALGGFATGVDVIVDDIHTRHLAEQLVGASLEVRSTVLGVDALALRLYHELVNIETGARAATFIHVVTGSDATRTRQPIPQHVITAVGERIGQVPEHGRPRSIDLGESPVTPPLTLLQSLDLHMRQPRTITAAECDADGRFPADGYAELTWGGEPRTDREHAYFNAGPDGERLAWAVLESRATTIRLPRVGDRIQSFGALRELGNKTSHRMHWVYDVDSGDPLVTFEVVDICFDLDARRAAVIPESIRSSERFEYHPELFA